MNTKKRLAQVAVAVAITGLLVGNVVSAAVTYSTCTNHCWQGKVYFTYTGFCGSFSSAQALPDIRCGTSPDSGHCYGGTPVIDTGTLTSKMGYCDNDCGGNVPTGVSREGNNFSNPYMTGTESIKECDGDKIVPAP